MDNIDCDNVIDEGISKKGRHRKKQLYNSILQQMEFYFSDSNLSKDRFLSQLLSTDSNIDLEVFLKFNKIRRLTTNIEDIQKAVSKSDLIELTEDKTKIFRKKPVKIKENVDECTIYVESIKADATHDWLTQLFSEFGTVVYVSIPKYKHNKVNKGFAFVEFENEKQAQNALDYFDSIGCKMQGNPEDLQSIVTFEGDTTKADNINNKNVEETNTKKRRLSDALEENEKKIKIGEQHSTPENMVTDTSELEDDAKKKKKHKREHKKKNLIKESGLKILSKMEWKKMRNKYLDLQRKKMKEFKQYLNRTKFSQKNIHNEKCEKPNPIVEENKTESVLPKLEYVPGVIVKIKLSEPCTDAKKLKNEVKTFTSDVKYVDIPMPCGSEEIFLRFSDSESANEFCKQEFQGEKILLRDAEEKNYWDKIMNDRSIKCNKVMKKQRGRDKLLKKAEKELAKHIRFDEAE